MNVAHKCLNVYKLIYTFFFIRYKTQRTIVLDIYCLFFIMFWNSLTFPRKYNLKLCRLFILFLLQNEFVHEMEERNQQWADIFILRIFHIVYYCLELVQSLFYTYIGNDFFYCHLLLFKLSS